MTDVHTPITVILVDDDPLTIELHREHLRRTGGFEVIAECRGARSALDAMLAHPTANLVLLDVTMPDGSGLEVLRAARAHGIRTEVIAVSGVREADVVREMVALGAVQYLVKPYSFAMFRERIERFCEYHRRASRSAGPATQAEIDALFAALRPESESGLPKGLSTATLAEVLAVVQAASGCTAAEVAQARGISREVARRYLEYLANAARVERRQRYGGRGRPRTEYHWRGQEYR